MTTNRALAAVGLTAVALFLRQHVAAAADPLSQGVAVLAPGDRTLVPLASSAASEDVAVLRAASGDTTERAFSHVTRSEHASTVNSIWLVMSSEWAPPLASKDSIVLERIGLRPMEEDLVFNRVHRSYRYDGARVSGIVLYPDSAPKPYDHTFDQPVFAFNEVEPLVRSLDYRRGLRVVVPLFSEVDQALERDTLSVEDGSPTRATWVVRFADPVITTRYVVDARTRHIVDAVTTNRKSGGRYHYRY